MRTGRPKMPDAERRSYRPIVRLNEFEYLALKRLSVARDCTMSQVVRDLLADEDKRLTDQ